MAKWYCEEVVAGRVNSPIEEVQACQRFLDMVARAKTGHEEFYWSPEHVVDICAFTELLPHVKGFDGTIVLEPVQMWWLAGIFGFRQRGTHLRYVRQASLWMPRKNAKTTISAGIVLYCSNFEKEPGSEVTISAGSEKQAHIPYDIICKMLEKEPELIATTGAYVTKRYTTFRKTGAVINVATSKSQNLDGYNPHVVLAEELHAQSQAVINVLRTAMGARRNPLFLSISTAGRDTNAAAYDDFVAGRALLSGKTKNDRAFVVIYAATEAEAKKRFDWKIIERVNPLWGVSLQKPAIQEEQEVAKRSEGNIQEYLRTRLNVWARGAGNLISVDAWNACSDHNLSLEAMKGFPMFVGIDLASRSDLNAASFMIDIDKTVYMTARYWLPAKARRMEDDRFAPKFAEWSRDGYLKLTPGAFIDFRIILAEILAQLEGHNVIGVGLDDYQANLMAAEIEAAGYRVFIVPKTAKALTQSTEDLIARVADPHLFQHDGNPVSAWCAGNVVGYWDANDNVLPKKEKRGSRANIDGVDAAIIANALRIDWKAGVLGLRDKDKDAPNPWLAQGRGLPGQAA